MRFKTFFVRCYKPPVLISCNETFWRCIGFLSTEDSWMHWNNWMKTPQIAANLYLEYIFSMIVRPIRYANNVFTRHAWQVDRARSICRSHFAFCTCMECPVGLRGNLKVSLKDGSLSCRQILVFFLMILFWVATFTTYNFTYRSEGKLDKWWLWICETAN